VSDQRAPRAGGRSEIAVPGGVPWWGAVLIALSATLLGIAIEAGSGHRELGAIFAVLYALGCLAAVVAVRRAGIFTAVIQPPLLLFVGVPLAYYLLHGSEFGGFKDVIITCGYPLIERFPLMLFTSAAVLLIGLVRWYLVMSAPGGPQPLPAAGPRGPGVMAALSTRLASAFAGNGAVDGDHGARPARPRHVVDRAAAKRRSPPQQERRNRRNRPAAEGFARASAAPGEAAPRSRRTARRPDREDQWTPEPRRGSRDPRRTPPPPRRERPDPRDQHAARPMRGSRFEPYETGRGYQPHPRSGPHPPYQPRRRPVPGADSHHPVSQVRYRGSVPPQGAYDAGSDGGPPRGRTRR